MALPYKLLAVDVDGTLLDSRNRLPEANRLAMRRAHEAGLTVCLCTGRSLTEAREPIEALGLGLDLGIFVFGALISALPGGETLHRTAIPQPLASRLVEHFQARGFPVLLLYDVREAGVDYELLRGERNAAAYERWLSLTPTRYARTDTWQPGRHEPLRIGIIVDPAHVDELAKGLRDEFSPGTIKFNSIFAPNYGLHVVECFAPEVNKWYGLMRVASERGVEPSQIVAIGDDINDLEMIRQSGLGIAMGNAAEPIRAVARWQAPGHDEAGLAAAIDALLDGAARIDGHPGRLIIPARTCSPSLRPAAPK